MTLRRTSFLLVFLFARNAYAQDALGWNSARALQLIDRARLRRELPRGDTSLQNYQAKANGYVYFYLDRREADERTLVKVDQVALDLYWKRPNLTKQRIVGMRDVSRLPNRMYYHLDHLTVVQNNLGDVIRLGDGDEVRDVPHPAAPGADSIYDYRLADSVTLQLGGDQGNVRVYELQVRPKRVDRSAFVGSVFVDRDAADIVRMTFTFTPVSYVDRRLDYINISLDNGLFGGKYWLPNEQSVEIRRQIPELDFAAGAIIKGRFRVSNYVFNEPIPDSVFYGRPVSAVSQQERENFPFPADIYAGINEEGLAPPPQMADLRARAAELLGQPRLSGLPAWRLYVPNASSVLRRNNTEGWYGGLGVTYAPTPVMRVDVTAGYAFRAERPELTVTAHREIGDTRIKLSGFYNAPRDIGPIAGMPGVLNTLSITFGGEDYTNTYLTRGGSVEFVSRKSAWHPGVQLSAEQHRNGAESNALTGTMGEFAFVIRRASPENSGVSWDATARAGVVVFGHYNDLMRRTLHETFPRITANANYRRRSADARSNLELAAHGGVVSRDGGGQFLFLLGGRETLPGYDYRSYVADRFVLIGGAHTQTLFYPWIGVRFVGALSFMHDIEPKVALSDDFKTHRRSSFGTGFSFLWDVIHVDFVKGARTQTLVSVRHDFWDLL
jgi:hypothetical protein